MKSKEEVVAHLQKKLEEQQAQADAARRRQQAEDADEVRELGVLVDKYFSQDRWNRGPLSNRVRELRVQKTEGVISYFTKQVLAVVCSELDAKGHRGCYRVEDAPETGVACLYLSDPLLEQPSPLER